MEGDDEEEVRMMWAIYDVKVRATCHTLFLPLMFTAYK